MRLKNLMLGELKILSKYGIFLLYGIFTIIYLSFLGALPPSARGIAVTVLVFTDPAAMGLFFMGAVVLLEKSQRVESSLAVSPIKVSEYMMSKILPFLITGTWVGGIIFVFGGGKNIGPFLIGVALSSVLFSLVGLLVGSKIATLNGFMIATVPFEVILCFPAILYVFGVIPSRVWLIHPGVAAIHLMKGEKTLWYLAGCSLLLWNISTYIFCKRAVEKSFRTMGGAKL